MYCTQVNVIRKAALTGLFALCASSTAFSQTTVPATGLGQSWPNTTDVSASPNWHVYVFVLNGIKYVQVNDLNGTVHAAVGAAHGAAVVLPVGVDAQNVSTLSAASTASVSLSSTQAVYSDDTTTVTATPQSDGTTHFNVMIACKDGSKGCSGNGGP